MMVDYFEVLGVERDADDETIRAQVRKQRSRYRQLTGSPDKSQARSAEEMIERLSEAERILRDPAARAAYVRHLESEEARGHEETARARAAHIAAEMERAEQQRRAVIARSNEWIEQAERYLRIDEPLNAIRAATEATRIDESAIEAWEIRVKAAIRLKNAGEADFASSQVVWRAPNDAYSHGLRGYALQMQQRLDEAEPVFRRAAELDPADPRWQDELTWSLFRRDRLQDALASAEVVYRKFTDFPNGARSLSLLLMEQMDLSLSLDYGHHLITSEKQISHVEQTLAALDAIGSTDPDVLLRRAALEELLTAAKRHSFRPKVLWILAAAAFAIFGWGLLYDHVSPLAAVGVGLGILLMGYRSMVTVGWRKARRGLTSHARIGI